MFGLLVAWVLVRYRFPASALVDALVDLPFALPTAVAGHRAHHAYTPTTAGSGATSQPLGIKVAFAPLGRGRGADVRRAAVRGAHGAAGARGSRSSTRRGRRDARAPRAGRPFARVIFPALLPALLTGFALAFARALGEYGSVVFISGNMPMKTEIVPLLIVTKLEQYDYAGATAIAVVMLAGVVRAAAWSSTCSALDRDGPRHERRSRATHPLGREPRRDSAPHPSSRASAWLLIGRWRSRSWGCSWSCRSSPCSPRRSQKGLARLPDGASSRTRRCAAIAPDAAHRGHRRCRSTSCSGVAAAWLIAKYRFPRARACCSR